MGDIFCGLSVPLLPGLWAFRNGCVASASNTTCGELLTSVLEPSRTPLQPGTSPLENTKAPPCRQAIQLQRLAERRERMGAERTNRPQTVLIIAVPASQGEMGGGQKREGDFSCEISPSLLRFSEIRFGFQITTLVIPESLGTHELQPVLLPHSSDHTRRKSFPSAVLFQLPGSSLVADSRRRLLVRFLLLEDHSSAETNSTLDQ